VLRITFEGPLSNIEALRRASRLYDEYLETYRKIHGSGAGERKGGARMVIAVDEKGRWLGEDSFVWSVVVAMNRAAKDLESSLEQQKERS